MDIEKSSKLIALIMGLISLLSSVAALLLGDQGRRGQIIVISVLAILLAFVVYVGANKTRKGIYDVNGKLKKTRFPIWGFVSLAGIFILWTVGIAGLLFATPKPLDIHPLAINLINSSKSDITIDARADFELLIGARVSAGTTIARGTLNLVAADGKKMDFLTIPANSNLLVAGYFRNPFNYQNYLENGDADIQLYLYKSGGQPIISQTLFRFDADWLEKYRLDLETSDNSPAATAVPLATPTFSDVLTSEPNSATSTSQDSKLACIDSEFWTPDNKQVIKDKSGCWQLFSQGMSAQNGDLLFFLEPPNYGSSGIYTTIPTNSNVGFSIQINKMDPGGTINIGIVPQDTHELAKGYYLSFEYYIRDDSQGNARSYVQIGINKPRQTKSYYTTNYSYLKTHDIVFQLDEISLTILFDGKAITTYPINIPFDKRDLWIGHDTPINRSLSARISGLYINKK